MSLLLKSYSFAFKTFKNRPSLFTPFLAFAIVEFLALIVLFLSPRLPFSLVLAPLIRTFWGEKFLHYPVNFLLLPKLSSLSKLVLYVVFGSIFSGTAVHFISEVFQNKKKSNVAASFFFAAKKYIYLFGAILLLTVLYYYSVKIPSSLLMKHFISGHSRLLFLKAEIWIGPILAVFNFATGVVLQAAFLYIIPFLVIDNEKLLRAIGKSVILFKKLFLQSLVIVTLPSLLYIPFIILNYNTPFLIQNLFPEAVLLTLIAALTVNSLIIDTMMTSTSTVLFLLYKEQGIKK
jgi:hypothetical protein